MDNSIFDIIRQIQGISEDQDGILSGGFISLNNLRNGPLTPSDGAINEGSCRNHVCTGSTNKEKCANTYSCDGAKNAWNGCGNTYPALNM